jgi:histidyl-tRNA synthetase
MGLKVVLVLGPDEVAAGKLAVKDLAKGTQETVAISEVASMVKRILESG